MNSTLSGHTDHSEFDLTSPLISIRYASIRICIFSPVQQHLFAAKPMEGFIEYVHRIPSRIKIGGGGGGGGGSVLQCISATGDMPVLLMYVHIVCILEVSF